MTLASANDAGAGAGVFLCKVHNDNNNKSKKKKNFAMYSLAALHTMWLLR